MLVKLAIKQEITSILTWQTKVQLYPEKSYLLTITHIVSINM